LKGSEARDSAYQKQSHENYRQQQQQNIRISEVSEGMYGDELETVPKCESLQDRLLDKVDMRGNGGVSNTEIG